VSVILYVITRTSDLGITKLSLKLGLTVTYWYTQILPTLRYRGFVRG